MEVSQDDGEGEFGFVTLDRTHTLKSFAAYADWVKAMHFNIKNGQVHLYLQVFLLQFRQPDIEHSSS